jgi:hypothetical protein
MKTPTDQSVKRYKHFLNIQTEWIAIVGLVVGLTATQNIPAATVVTSSSAGSNLSSNVTTTATSSNTTTTITYFQMGTNALSVSDNYFSFNSGAYLLNPYKVVNTNQIAPSDAKAVFYLQLSFDYVAAWNLERRQRFVRSYLDKDKGFGGWNGIKFQNPLPWKTDHSSYETLDISGNISYFLQGNSQPTASTIVGAGDFSAEISLGIPLVIGVFTDDPHLDANMLGGDSLTNLYAHTTSVHWVGLVESYGVTTDRGDLDAHSRFFTGLGYRAAYRSPFGNLREVLVSVQLGCGLIDSTHFVNSTDSTIEMEHGVPKYFLEPGFAIESEFRVPISKSADLNFGASVYSNHHPDSWNAHIGLTFPLEKLTDFLK